MIASDRLISATHLVLALLGLPEITAV